MKAKYSIKVPPTKIELYKVFKNLEKNQRTIFSFPDRTKHSGLARSIGIVGKPLIERKLLIPPLSSTNQRRMTGVQLPIGVKTIEKKKGFFDFFEE